jgi:PIN domain nuclease of toxin-antitoxin system
MKLLLDTHTLVWSMNATSELSQAAREAIESFENEIQVSVVTVWEAATKHRLGKFPEAGAFVGDPRGVLNRLGFSSLSLKLEHAHLSGTFAHPHRDPFDRMLAAQAILDGLTLVSNDKVFDTMLVPRIW